MKNIIKQKKIELMCLVFGLFFLFLASFVYAEKTDVFLIQLNYKNGDVSLKSISLVKMNYFSPLSEEGDYKIVIESYSREILFSQKFDFNLVMSYEPASTDPDELDFEDLDNGIISLNESSKELIIPYFQNAKKLIVYDKDNQIVLTYDLSLKYTKETPEKITKEKEFPYLIPIIISSLMILSVIILLFYYKYRSKLK